MRNMSYYQLSNEKNAFNNVLDLVFVNEIGDFDMEVDKARIIGRNQQDPAHVPYEITFTYCKKDTSMKNRKTQVVCYKSGHYERMRQQLEQINFQHEINSRDIDSAMSFFHSTMETLVINNVPTKTITLNDNKPVWWNKRLQRLKNRRDKLYKRRHYNVAAKNHYEDVMREFDDLSEKTFQRYIDNVQADMALNPAEFRNFVKVNRKSTSSYPTEMYLHETNGSTPNQIVDLFADFFESSYVPDDLNWSFEDVYQTPLSYEEIDVSLHDIETAIHLLKWKGGLGPDAISPFVIKMCAESLTWPLWLLFQKMFEGGRIPSALKTARVVPVFKKGSRKNIENYKIVIITSAILKIFQMSMKKCN